MEKYDYYKEVANDIICWMDNDDPFDISKFEDRDEAADYLVDALWALDEITGNGPDTYGSEHECEEYLCHNLDLVFEACECFDTPYQVLRNHLHEGNLARYLDATVRCYVLSAAVEMALQEWESYGFVYKENVE